MIDLDCRNASTVLESCAASLRGGKRVRGLLQCDCIVVVALSTLMKQVISRDHCQLVLTVGKYLVGRCCLALQA